MGFFDRISKNLEARRVRSKKEREAKEKLREEQILKRDVEDARAFQREWDEKHPEGVDSQSGNINPKLINFMKKFTMLLVVI